MENAPKSPAHTVPNLHNFKTAIPTTLSHGSCYKSNNSNPERFHKLRCAPTGGKKVPTGGKKVPTGGKKVPTGGKEVQGEKAGLRASSLFEAES